MELNKHDKIRLHYSYLTDLILDRSKIRNSNWVSPYCDIDWASMFTPIEEQMWGVIRGFGHAPFYPQYPVGNYFLDFGNPSVKVGIECDGALYHQDKERDYKRDKWLFDNGWTIYRISGSDCVKSELEIDEDNIDITENETTEIDIYNSEKTCLGLIKAIGIYHFDYQPFYPQTKQFELAMICLLKRVSIRSKEHENLINKVLSNFYSRQTESIN